MTFRDDHDAALARIDALERENVQLIDENSTLRGKRSPYALLRRPSRIRDDRDVAIAHVEALEIQKRGLAAENEKLRGGAPPPPVEPAHRKWRLNDEGDPEDAATQKVILIVVAVILAVLSVIAGIVDKH